MVVVRDADRRPAWWLAVGPEKNAEDERQPWWILPVGWEGGSAERWWVWEG